MTYIVAIQGLVILFLLWRLWGVEQRLWLVSMRHQAEDAIREARLVRARNFGDSKVVRLKNEWRL